MSRYANASWDNTSTNSTNVPAWHWRKAEVPMIETPAYIHIDMFNNTRIAGRFVRYSDPTRADSYSAFVAEDAEGTTQYVLWAGILRVSVFPLGGDVPAVPKPEQIQDKPASS